MIARASFLTVGQNNSGNKIPFPNQKLKKCIFFEDFLTQNFEKYLQFFYFILDGMQVIVSNTSPSILPYVKIRENPHVTSDEWRWIIQLGIKLSRTNFKRASAQQSKSFTVFIR